MNVPVIDAGRVIGMIGIKKYANSQIKTANSFAIILVSAQTVLNVMDLWMDNVCHTHAELLVKVKTKTVWTGIKAIADAIFAVRGIGMIVKIIFANFQTLHAPNSSMRQENAQLVRNATLSLKKENACPPLELPSTVLSARIENGLTQNMFNAKKSAKTAMGSMSIMATVLPVGILLL